MLRGLLLIWIILTPIDILCQSLINITKDTASVISSNLVYSNQKLYYFKTNINNPTSHQLWELDLVLYQPKKLGEIESDDAPQVLGADKQKITILVPFSLEDRKLLSFDLILKKFRTLKPVQNLYETYGFTSTYFMKTTASDLVGYVLHDNDVFFLKDSLKAAIKLGSILHPLAIAPSSCGDTLFVLDKKNDHHISLNIISSRQNKIIETHSIDFIKEELKPDSCSIFVSDHFAYLWVRKKQYETILYKYDFKNEQVRKTLLEAKIGDVAIADTNLYVNLLYHSNRFYEWRLFGDEKLGAFMTLDIEGNLFSLKNWSNSYMSPQDGDSLLFRDIIAKPGTEPYERLEGVGDKKIDVQVQSDRGDLKVVFQALGIRDKLTIKTYANAAEYKVLYQSRKYVAGTNILYLRIPKLTNLNLVFEVKCRTKKSRWRINYKIE